MPRLAGPLRRTTRLVASLFVVVGLGVGAPRAAEPAQWFRIITVDAEGKPLPGVRLRTTNDIVLVSDQGGNIALFEPGLMGVEVYFGVERAGYAFPADGFGFRGVRLTTTPGATSTVALTPDGADPFAADTPWGDAMTRRLAGAVPAAADYFALRAVDAQTGEGVPLVRFSTPALVPAAIADVAGSAWTDSGGWVAWYEPGHMGEDVVFDVVSDGYRLEGAAASGAGGPDSLTLKTLPGTVATVKMQRLLPAERLVRMTGQGVHREAELLGLREMSPLAGRVMGQDTVWTTPYKGKLFWLWGDTTRPEYPLGNFATSSATSPLDALPGPGVGVPLEYFVDSTGFSKPMAQVEGDGLTWLGELIAVASGDGGAVGSQTLVARFGKYPGLNPPTAIGLVRFDDADEVFEPLISWPLDALVTPSGSPTVASFGPEGARWVVFSKGVRIPATEAAFADPAGYEAWTPYADAERSSVLREPDGRPRYRWAGGGVPPARAAGAKGEKIAAVDALEGHERSLDTAEAFSTHDNDTVAYNPWRQRYVRVAQQLFGATSFLGELWLFEADTPLGPWVHGAHVITHDDYTFYNPRLHPYFAPGPEPGRVVFFEGTYTRSFTERDLGTPRYDYNQVMYRLDLGDPRVNLPVAVYARAGSDEPLARVDLAAQTDTSGSVRRLFYAAERPDTGLVPIGWSAPSCAANRQLVAGDSVLDVIGYGRPLAAPGPPAGMATLRTWRSDDGAVHARADLSADEAPAAATPLAFVWPDVTRASAPVMDFLPAVRAQAGVDLCVREGEPVRLDGSASEGAGPAESDVRWQVGTLEISGFTPTVSLPPGTHEVLLTVRSPSGELSRDRLLVAVSSSATGGPDVASDSGGASDLGTAGPETGDPSASGCGGCRGGQSPRGDLLVPWLLALLALRPRRRATRA